MTLPHLENAVVSREKLTKYLLSATHEDGAGKAGFFLLFGFRSDNWEELATVLLDHVTQHGIVREEVTRFGTRYVSEGPMRAADWRRPNLRSVWFIDTVRDIPRFVTACPLEGAKDD
jgi:hypothetical protein